jgi:hypothetical protein
MINFCVTRAFRLKQVNPELTVVPYPGQGNLPSGHVVYRRDLHPVLQVYRRATFGRLCDRRADIAVFAIPLLAM